MTCQRIAALPAVIEAFTESGITFLGRKHNSNAEKSTSYLGRRRWLEINSDCKSPASIVYLFQIIGNQPVS
jgi:hypothetical protein